ncbi:MAG: GYD domain-containing protein, partial [bacterium]
MQTYILLTKLSTSISSKVKDRKKIGRAWLEKVKKKCPEVTFVSHYALLGEYDFIDIYEAPDEETAAKVSIISLQNGVAGSRWRCHRTAYWGIRCGVRTPLRSAGTGPGSRAPHRRAPPRRHGHRPRDSSPVRAPRCGAVSISRPGGMHCHGRRPIRTPSRG